MSNFIITRKFNMFHMDELMNVIQTANEWIDVKYVVFDTAIVIQCDEWIMDRFLFGRIWDGYEPNCKEQIVSYYDYHKLWEKYSNE